ncbi:hypothetical protein HF086_005322 [Spodoptera exigua]|uniref:Uncharacterized protein n=1 Tax=Spodoptera exigua TaxID=7107 RepID=A0A922MZI0_SPOEX|nr:hypothetical protein HF086_005322 [Spodoptera exigua]
MRQFSVVTPCSSSQLPPSQVSNTAAHKTAIELGTLHCANGRRYSTKGTDLSDTLLYPDQHVDPIRPCHHDMWGQGPMQNVTTQRHDFVPKPCAIRESCKPEHKFHCVEQPFETKMESTTTQKMSYQPVCVPQPQRPPWACKGQYQKPCQRLEGTTIYRSSFLPPGEDCTEYMDPCKYGDCKPCDCICPAECITTDPCACNFPKAACC